MPALALATGLLIAEAAGQTTYNQALASDEFAPKENIVSSAGTAPNDLASFGDAMADAFAVFNGGVFDFSDVVTAGTTVLRGSIGDKDFQVTFSRGLQQFTNNNNSFQTSSGSRGITTNSTPGNYSMTFGPIRDGAGEPLGNHIVTKVGFAVMSRSGDAVYPLLLRATATFSNGSTEELLSTLSDASGNNIFYGFTAPPGLAIERVQLDALADVVTGEVIETGRIALDDIGLIVTEVPFAFSTITPEHSYLLPEENFQFGVDSPLGINPGDVTLDLNGADATGQLSFGGTPENRTLSITGLAPGTDYAAVVTVGHSGHLLSRVFHFTTREPAPELVDVSRNGSYLYPAAHFQVDARAYAGLTLDPANITLTLNGANANGQLVVGGTPEHRNLSITGLIPHQSYQATVTASSAHGHSSTRTYHFHTLGAPVSLADAGGFSDDVLYPTGNLAPVTDGRLRWQPQIGANQVQIVDSGDPAYGKVLRRTQGGSPRVDYLYFPPLADGVLKVSFDARVSEASHRTLDIALMPDTANNQNMAGFLQFGYYGERVSYYNNVDYVALEDFTLDTGWHHYELVHYYSGPHARTYDVLIDGVLVGEKIPWRSGHAFTEPLARMRFQTVTRPEGETEEAYADIDNIVITAQPLEVEPVAPPVTTTQLGQGVVYKKFTHAGLFSSSQNIFVTDINLNDPSIALAFPHGDGTLRTVPQLVAGVPGAVAAVNAQFFSFTTNRSIQHFKVGGTLVNPTIDAQDPQAIIDDGLGTPNSISIARRPAAGWESLDVPNIMATGPWLLRDGFRQDFGSPNDGFTDVRHPRTAAAWTYDNRLLLIVVDGRNAGVSDGMTIPELQSYIDTLGWVRHSTNYDGGGSTTLWANGGILNVPSDGSPRGVANAIAVTADPVAVPTTPSGVVAVEGDGGVTLYWQLSSGTTHYEVRRATSAEGPYEVIGSPAHTWFSDTTAAPGTDYFYVIVARNSAGESAGTPPLGTGPADGEPIVPAVAISLDAGTVNLTFGTESGRSYQLQRSTDLRPASWENIGSAVSGTGSAMTLQHTANGPAAFYRVLIE